MANTSSTSRAESPDSVWVLEYTYANTVLDYRIVRGTLTQAKTWAELLTQNTNNSWRVNEAQILELDGDLVEQAILTRQAIRDSERARDDELAHQQKLRQKFAALMKGIKC